MTDCPLWHRQPRERLQTYLYKKIYIMELKGANKKLKDVIEYIKKLPSETSLDVTLYHFSDNLIELPTEDQLKQMSKRYCWQEADEAYSNHLTELDHKRREENYQTSTDRIDDLIDTMFDLVEESAEELKTTEYKTSTKIQLEYTVSRTIDLLTKNKRLNHGRPTTISKADVDVDAEVEFGGFENLIGAFDASKKEWDKHKQQ